MYCPPPSHSAWEGKNVYISAHVAIQSVKIIHMLFGGGGLAPSLPFPFMLRAETGKNGLLYTVYSIHLQYCTYCVSVYRDSREGRRN